MIIDVQGGYTKTSRLSKNVGDPPPRLSVVRGYLHPSVMSHKIP